jgi:hypothetical protein
MAALGVTGRPSRRRVRPREIFGYSYDKLAAMAKKPMMIAETASAESGGDKAVWIRKSLLIQAKVIPAHKSRHLVP